MICSTDCERNHHHLCDGWYGHQTTPCECACHSAASIEQEDTGLTYVVCDWLLDPETNRHCEFDGDVKLDANRNWRCPGCGRHRWAPPDEQTEADRG